MGFNSASVENGDVHKLSFQDLSLLRRCENLKYGNILCFPSIMLGRFLDYVLKLAPGFVFETIWKPSYPSTVYLFGFQIMTLRTCLLKQSA